MSQIAEELTFAVLSVTKFENSRCSWEFSKVSQKAKVAPFLSTWPLGATTMLIGHRGCLKNAKKWPFLGTILSFLWKTLKTGNIISQISPWKQRLQKKQSIPWRSRRKMPCNRHQENFPRPILWGVIPQQNWHFFDFSKIFKKAKNGDFVWKIAAPRMGLGEFSLCL